MTTAIEPSLTLAQIAPELQGLLRLMEDALAEGETPECIAAIDQQIDEYVVQTIQEADGIAHAIRTYELAAETCDEEITRIMRRRDGFRATAGRIRQHSIKALEAIPGKRVESALNTLRSQRNGGVEPLEIPDPLVVPSEYKRVVVEIPWCQWQELALRNFSRTVKSISTDNEKIREALKRGEKVPGARLRERGTQLRCE